MYALFLVILVYFSTSSSMEAPESNIQGAKKKMIILPDIDGVVIAGRSSGLWLKQPENAAFRKKINEAAKITGTMDLLLNIEQILRDYSRNRTLKKQCEEFKIRILTAKRNEETIAILRLLKAQNPEYDVIILPATNMGKTTFKGLCANGTLPTDLFCSDKKTFFAQTKKCNKNDDGTFNVKPDERYFF